MRSRPAQDARRDGAEAPPRLFLVPLWIGLAMSSLVPGPTSALDTIPQTSGFSGFVLAMPGFATVESNLIVSGPPIVGDVGNPRIDSIFDAPTSKSSAVIGAAGEVNYTFASTRTQLFFGNRLEDLLRLDVAFGLGVRQELPDGSVLAASGLFTPLQLKFWSDPYVEGEDRQKTELNFPGFRLRWGGVLGTGLEFTLTDRFYRFDEERSGDWLIDRDRLDPARQPLLNRDGDVLRLQALYRFDLEGGHRFEPTIRYISDAHDGRAVANLGYALKLSYLYLSPRFVVDVNLVYGHREFREVHPVYDEKLDADRWGVSILGFLPVKLFGQRGWSVFAGGETFHENVNVDFFDSRITIVNAGLVWRHRRP